MMKFELKLNKILVNFQVKFRNFIIVYSFYKVFIINKKKIALSLNSKSDFDFSLAIDMSKVTKRKILSTTELEAKETKVI